MILVDTTIWIDHLHTADERLQDLLLRRAAATHPMVRGELAVGSIRSRQIVLARLARLPVLTQASHSEVLELIEMRSLHGVA
jgi:predicted nucleic acid-binding protein